MLKKGLKKVLKKESAKKSAQKRAQNSLFTQKSKVLKKVAQKVKLSEKSDFTLKRAQKRDLLKIVLNSTTFVAAQTDGRTDSRMARRTAELLTVFMNTNT